jgi:kynurenine formamidase
VAAQRIGSTRQFRNRCSRRSLTTAAVVWKLRSMPRVPDKLPRYRDLPVDPRYPQKTAWGLFGEDDDIGMFNLQTPERVAAAARRVRKGAVFALNWEQHKPDPPLFGRGALRHTVFRKNPVGHHGDDVLDNFYPQASSQWDGLTHVGDYEHGFWGGVTVQQLRASGDKHRLGIDHWARRGIAGRCVLLDVARFRAAQGRPIDCATADPISVEDLEGTRTSQGVTPEPGDVWLVRTGWIAWYEQQRYRVRMALADRGSFKAPGLLCSEAMAEYLFDHHPAAIAGDNPALECWPPPNALEPDGFLHHYLLGRFGIAIGEMFVLDALADDCAQDGVFEAFFTSAPLNIKGGTGSPPNALAIK